MMNRAAQNQGDIRHELRVQDEGVLGESLIALIGDIDEIRVVHSLPMCNLSTLAMLLQSLDGHLEHIRVADIGPSAHQRTLPHLGHICKTVIIVIVSLIEYLVMT